MSHERFRQSVQRCPALVYVSEADRTLTTKKRGRSDEDDGSPFRPTWDQSTRRQNYKGGFKKGSQRIIMKGES